MNFLFNLYNKVLIERGNIQMEKNSKEKFKKFSTERTTVPYGVKGIHTTGMKDELDWIKRQLQYITYSENNVLRFDLKKGEIYEFDWGINVNAEFSNRHFGVVLVDSDIFNPLVTVCPLKTNHAHVNPKSDIVIGPINGLYSRNDAVAVVNQIRTMDKMRIYTRTAINKVNIDLLSDVNDEAKMYIPRLEKSKLKLIEEGLRKYLDGTLGDDSEDKK